jgi:hypothetical protein
LGEKTTPSSVGPTGELVLVAGLFSNGKPQVFANISSSKKRLTFGRP